MQDNTKKRRPTREIEQLWCRYASMIGCATSRQERSFSKQDLLREFLFNTIVAGYMIVCVPLYACFSDPGSTPSTLLHPVAPFRNTFWISGVRSSALVRSSPATHPVEPPPP
eukprot:13292696-Alexandrium_andersonii.AAC.1